MNYQKWLSKNVKTISSELAKKSMTCTDKTYYAIRAQTIEVLKNLCNLVHPGVYEPMTLNAVGFIENKIKLTATDLCHIINNVLQCKYTNDNNYKEKAQNITVKVIEELPFIRELLYTDIQAAYEGDPAAKSFDEVIMSYPSIRAISVYRIAHLIFSLDVPIIPRIMTEYAHRNTGIDIHPGAKIGSSFFIDHGTGVVIGETCTIGNNVKVYQGVTLGAKSFPLDEQGNPIKGIKRHPDIEDNVIIYAGATILGGNTKIGRNAVIGGNVWLTKSVPPNSTVFNAQPSPIIKPKI